MWRRSRALDTQHIRPALGPFEILFVLTAAIDQAYLGGRPATDDFLERLVKTSLR